MNAEPRTDMPVSSSRASSLSTGLGPALGAAGLALCVAGLLGLVAEVRVFAGFRSLALAVAGGLLGGYASLDALLRRRNRFWLGLGMAGLGLGIAVAVCRAGM